MPDLHLFEGYGVELEYMIVERDSLKVFPVADKLLENVAGHLSDLFDNGDIAWCNELALHVIEFKTAGPAKSLQHIGKIFHSNILKANEILSSLGAMLLPTAMHPLMDPYKELKIWPYGQKDIYETYNKIFDCKGHGWANLQSVHLNLPFANDQEFEMLHAAIRLILPILPALAASSPLMDGKLTGMKDNRMNVYMTNQSKIPSIAGKIVPEQVWTKQDYHLRILDQNYKDIAPYDPSGLLQEEWLNSRGAIARFTRMAIEIRVLDIQECPAADIAILKLIVHVLKLMIQQVHSDTEFQKSFHEDDLFELLKACIITGEDTIITNPGYLKAFGIQTKSCSARELWSHLLTNMPDQDSEDQKILEFILKEGTLSSRIEKILDSNSSEQKIKEVYLRLAECLQKNDLFKI